MCTKSQLLPDQPQAWYPAFIRLLQLLEAIFRKFYYSTSILQRAWLPLPFGGKSFPCRWFGCLETSTQTYHEIFGVGISSNFSDDQPYSWSQAPFHPQAEAFKNAKVCSNPDGSLGMNLICPVQTEFQPLGTLPDIGNNDYLFLGRFWKYHNFRIDERSSTLHSAAGN